MKGDLCNTRPSSWSSRLPSSVSKEAQKQEKEGDDDEGWRKNRVFLFAIIKKRRRNRSSVSSQCRSSHCCWLAFNKGDLFSLGSSLFSFFFFLLPFLHSLPSLLLHPSIPPSPYYIYISSAMAPTLSERLQALIKVLFSSSRFLLLALTHAHEQDTSTNPSLILCFFPQCPTFSCPSLHGTLSPLLCLPGLPSG